MTKTPKPTQSENPKPFETAFAELEVIVGELEGGNLTLDASVERFRKASDLAEYCKTMINEARLQVTELVSEQPTQATLDGAGDDVPF